MMQHGVLNLLKPPGMTSHDAVAFVRRVLKNKRVGHDDVLSPAGHEYNDFGDVVWCEGLAATIEN